MLPLGDFIAPVPRRPAISLIRRGGHAAYRFCPQPRLSGDELRCALRLRIREQGLQAAFLATKSSRFNSLLQEYRMTDLIKALRERREELRNELQEHPLFQEYE